VNNNEMNSTKRNIKEKIKIFWKDFNKNWVWVNIGAYGAWMISSWSLFFIGILDLIRVIFSTILGLAIFSLLYILKHIRKPKLLKIITGIVLVGCGSAFFGFIMWFITVYVLIQAPWAPLQALPPVVRGRILLLLVISSYAIAAYIMYRIGKKRKWRPPSHFEIE